METTASKIKAGDILPRGTVASVKAWRSRSGREMVTVKYENGEQNDWAPDTVVVIR